MKSSIFAVDHDMMGNRKQYLILIGNPGVGKSTLLNALLGRTVFRSGISPGGGLTKALKLVEEPSGSNFVYGDTPGLADVKSLHNAAIEITKALKQDGIYKLVFAVTEESLCVRPEDVATINIVLNTIKVENGYDVPYGIIVNKITETKLRRLRNNNEEMKLFQDCFIQKHRTNQFHFFLHEDALNDEDNAFHTPTDELREFLSGLDCLDIKPSSVLNIKTHLFAGELESCSHQNANLEQIFADIMARREQAVRNKRFKCSDVAVVITQNLRPSDRVMDRLKLAEEVEHEIEKKLKKSFGIPSIHKSLTLEISLEACAYGVGMIQHLCDIIFLRSRSYPMLEIDYKLESKDGVLVQSKFSKEKKVIGVDKVAVLELACDAAKEIEGKVQQDMNW